MKKEENNTLYTNRKWFNQVLNKSYAIVLIITLSIPLFATNELPDNKQKTEKKSTSASSIFKPGKKQAILILSNGQQVELSQSDTTIFTGNKQISIKVDSTGISYINTIPNSEKTNSEKRAF